MAKIWHGVEVHSANQTTVYRDTRNFVVMAAASTVYAYIKSTKKNGRKININIKASRVNPFHVSNVNCIASNRLIRTYLFSLHTRPPTNNGSVQWNAVIKKKYHRRNVLNGNIRHIEFTRERKLLFRMHIIHFNAKRKKSEC